MDVVDEEVVEVMEEVEDVRDGEPGSTQVQPVSNARPECRSPKLACTTTKHQTCVCLPAHNTPYCQVHRWSPEDTAKL